MVKKRPGHRKNMDYNLWFRLIVFSFLFSISPKKISLKLLNSWILGSSVCHSFFEKKKKKRLNLPRIHCATLWLKDSQELICFVQQMNLNVCLKSDNLFYL